MAYEEEGYLLIIAAGILLIAFALAVLAVMIIYRKRKLEHLREIDQMNETFSRELLQTQLEVQQQTMQYIGREIHDNVGQKLTLAALYVLQLDREDNGIQQKIDEVSAILNESLSDLRGLSKNLTEASHSQTDLYQLISVECARTQATGRCTVLLESSHLQVKVPLSVKNIILRIVQEFLQNSLKHADCTTIQVHLQEEEGGLTITAADDGKGFIPEDMQGHEGIGLNNIRKRANMINARIAIVSNPGKGTRMQLFIPLNG